MKLGTIIFILVFGKVCIFGTEDVNSFCVSPQFFQIGTKSAINCMFQENYMHLFWYDPTDPLHSNAVVIVQNSVKQGRGLLSGAFDIDANGSLIINNVTLEHEGTFTALLLQTLESNAVRFDVQVFVFVIWQPRGFVEVEYHLNLVSGTWESKVNDAVVAMTHEDYEREVKEFKIRYRHQETNDPSRVMEENEIVEADESRM